MYANMAFQPAHHLDIFCPCLPCASAGCHSLMNSVFIMDVASSSYLKIEPPSMYMLIFPDC
jgi:hypothetical protein